MAKQTKNSTDTAVDWTNRHAIDLARVEAGETERVLALLTKLESDLSVMLYEGGLKPGQQAKLQAIHKAASEAIGKTYKKVSAQQELALTDVAEMEAKAAAQLVNKQIGVDVFNPVLTETQWTALAKKTNVFGHKSGDWWKAQEKDLRFKFQGEIQQGYALGESVDEMVQRIRGTKAGGYKDGIMQTSRRNAEALVRSSIQTISNEARLASYEEMGDVVKGIQWVATIDSRTTHICKALDGLQWRAEDKKPIGHNKDFPGPTAHWNCRSTQVAVMRSWDELSGKKLPKLDNQTLEEKVKAKLAAKGVSQKKIDAYKAKARASMDGQVSSDTDYEKWLKSKPDDYVRDLLGPGRYGMWKAGKIKARDLTDQKNRPLTIEQLKATIEAGGPPPETEGVDFTKYVKPKSGPSKAANSEAAATMADIIANPKGKQYKAQAIKKLQKEEPDLQPAEMLAKAEGMAQEKQAAATKGAALSVAKKKIAQGGKPTAGQQKYIDQLDPSEKLAFDESVEELTAKIKQEKATKQAEGEIVRLKAKGGIYADAVEHVKKTKPDGDPLDQLTAIHIQVDGVANAKLVNLMNDPQGKKAIKLAKEAIVADGNSGITPAGLVIETEKQLEKLQSEETAKATKKLVDIATSPKGQMYANQELAKKLGVSAKKLQAMDSDTVLAALEAKPDAAKLLGEVEAGAQAKQAAATKAAKLSTAKKKLVQGKKLSPAETKALADLTPEELDNFNLALVDAKKAAETAPPPEPTKAKPKKSGMTAKSELEVEIPEASSLKKIQELSGSTRPYLAEDQDGKKWVVKSAERIDRKHLESEALADALYRAAGVDVPASQVDKTGKVAEFIEDAQTLQQWKAGKSKAEIEKVHAQLKDGFVMDSLLANWDVAGATNDNILVTKEGKPIRIDNGGALFFRAQGGAKQLPPEVGELKTLRDRSLNPTTSEIFGTITQGEINDQIKRIIDRKEQILQTAPAGKTRKALSDRIDWLEAQLPAEQKRATSTVVDSVDRFHSRFEDAVKTGYGTPILAGSSSFEDHELLAWRERDPKGKQVVKIHGKLTRQQSDELVQRFQAEGLDVKSETPANPQKPSSKASNYDGYWSQLQAAAKTIGVHAADGQYNKMTLQKYEATKKAIADIKSSLPAKPKKGSVNWEKAQLIKHYEGMIKDLDDAVANKKAPKGPPEGGFWKQWEKPEETKAAPKKSSGQIELNGVRISRNKNSNFNYTLKEITADGLVDNDSASWENTTGRRFELEAGPVKATIIPYSDESHSKTTARTLQGAVRVNIESNDNRAAVMEGLRVLESVGIDTAPPNQAQRELLYLHKTVYLRDKHTDSKYQQILNDDTMSETARVDAVKDWAEGEFGVKLPREKKDWHRYYNPEGEAPDTGVGHRVYRRFDVDAKDAKKKEANARFFHSGNIEAATIGWLRNGGQVTTTEHRLRTGVPMSDGASWRSDFNQGGAGFLYTNKATKAAAGTRQGFHFKGDLLSRVDIASHTYDSYGQWEAQEGSTRRRTLAEVNSGRGFGITINTGLFKNGMSMQDVEVIHTGSTYAADSLIARIKNELGLTEWPDGRKMEDVIKP